MLFCDGLAEWHKEHQLYFCRRGLRPKNACLYFMLMMLIHGPIAPLAAYIPVDVRVEQQTLRVGQNWNLSQRHGSIKTDDVIKIDGRKADLVVVSLYRVVIDARPSLVTFTGQRFTISC